MTGTGQQTGGGSVQNGEKESKEIKSGRGGARLGAGRPLGAPNKLTRPVKELAASYGPASISKLVQLRDGADSEQVQFAAAKELLDRAYGRPRQEIDLSGDQGVTIIVQRTTPQPVLDVQPALQDYLTDETETVEKS
jgi:hypothetical protein